MQEGALTWVSRWEGAAEGPFSLLAKLLRANALTPKQLESSIPWRFDSLHGVSLLDPPIECGGGLEVAGRWATLLRRSSLAERCPGAWKLLSDDRRFRYCPTCVAYGYQAAAFQVTSLRRCPIHDEDLQDKCRRCGASTPPYRGTASFNARFECQRCEAPWGHVSGGLAQWQEPPGVDRICSWTDWLERLGRSAWWMLNADKWEGTSLRDASDQGATAKQELFAAAMHRLVPTTEIPVPELDVSLLGPYRVRTNASKGLSAKERYVRARRRLMRPKMLAQFRDEFVSVSFGGFVPVDPRVPVDLHAWYLWRRQFEMSVSKELPLDDRSTGSVTALTLRDLTGCDDTAWAASLITSALFEPLVDAAWIAARRIAMSWRDHLIRSSEPAKEYAGLATMPAWRAQLGRWAEGHYCPVGIVVDRSTVSSDSVDVILVVA